MLVLSVYQEIFKNAAHNETQVACKHTMALKFNLQNKQAPLDISLMNLSNSLVSFILSCFSPIADFLMRKKSKCFNHHLIIELLVPNKMMTTDLTLVLCGC